MSRSPYHYCRLRSLFEWRWNRLDRQSARENGRAISRGNHYSGKRFHPRLRNRTASDIPQHELQIVVNDLGVFAGLVFPAVRQRG